ncbi:hypothetical protein GCM10022419_056680 [Nonomuraea rosea]|uniref:Recombination endonuclease VII n=1 Tax=Nonomuraea rosea TaxID=638574 RepID=A0ABP6XQT0_9ACTN
MRSQGKDPDELERGTWNGNKTHCPWGHAYEEYGGTHRDGSRYCRPCRVATQRKAMYGLDRNEYDSMLERQANRCLTCRQEFAHDGTRTTAHVDHDHQTGQVRGILCQQCNKALGLLYENVETMQRMIDYVLLHRSQTRPADIAEA